MKDNTMYHGSNIEVITGEDGTTVLRARSDTGTGTMMLSEVLPGIRIIHNDFHIQEIQSEFISQTELFCVDHCKEGRIEQEMNTGAFQYTEAGDLRIDNRRHHQTNFYFPLAHYHGITISFMPDTADNSIQKLFFDFPVSAARLQEKFCAKTDCFLLRSEETIEHIFSELYNVPSRSKSTT